MKKFYSLMLACAVGGATMFAAPKAPVAKALYEGEVAQAADFVKVGNQNTVKAPAKAAPAYDDMIGEWTFTCKGQLSSNSGETITKTVELIENEASITPKFYLKGIYGSYSLECTYDEEAGTLSIPGHQQIVYNTYYSEYIYFEHLVWTYDEDAGKYTPSVSSDPIVGTVSGNTISFSEYSSFSYQISQGYFFLAGYASMTKNAADSWVNVDGTASLVDPWFMSSFEFEEGKTQYDYPISLSVQNNESKPNQYRLVNPYAGSMFTSYNLDSNGGVGYIVFDFSDPDCVIILPGIYSGLTFQMSSANYMFYCNNNAGLYYNSGYTAAEIKKIASGAYNTDDNDYSFTLSTYDSDTKIITLADAYFGFKVGTTDNSLSGYKWNDADMTGAIDLSKVNFAGVTDITVDNNNNAPVQYYNLQGVRVDNPTSGIYIRRQGNTATKVLVK